MYSAEISRKNPGCFIFLLDQSASMEDPFGGSKRPAKGRRAGDDHQQAPPQPVHPLRKGDSIYDYFHVG